MILQIVQRDQNKSVQDTQTIDQPGRMFIEMKNKRWGKDEWKNKNKD